MPISLLPAVSGTAQHSWVDAASVEHPLNEAAGLIVELGRSGMAGPTTEPLTRDAAFDDGAVTLRVNVKTRAVQMPLYVRTDSPLALRDRLEQLGQWFSTRATPGYWRIVNEAGNTRQLACRLAKELDEVEQVGQRGYGFQRLLIELQAADEPYWQDVAATSAVYQVGGLTTSWFGRPWFPLILGASRILATPVIINTGTVEAWPIWTITGPGSALSLRNTSTGQTLDLTYSIPAGGVVAIDTRPRIKTISDGLGTNLFSLTSQASDFWSLQPGENRLQLELAGATAASAVGLSYTNQWLRP